MDKLYGNKRSEQRHFIQTQKKIPIGIMSDAAAASAGPRTVLNATVSFSASVKALKQHAAEFLTFAFCLFLQDPQHPG